MKQLTTVMLLLTDKDGKNISAFSIEARSINIELLETKLKEAVTQLGYGIHILHQINSIDELDEFRRRDDPDDE
jgi:hypothetical protein